MDNLENIIKDIVYDKNHRDSEGILFGSAVNPDCMWIGSDVNLMYISDEDYPATSSVTNYLFDDFSLRTPAILKRNINGILVQIEYTPISLLNERALYDWVLCDRLYCSRPLGVDEGKGLHQTVEYINRKRFESEVTAQRIDWYLSMVSDLLKRNLSATPSDSLFNLYWIGVFLGCAWLEKRKQPKKSYKRLLAQFEQAIDNTAIYSRLLNVLCLEGVTSKNLVDAIAMASQSAQSMQLMFSKNSQLLSGIPNDLSMSFGTTMGVSKDGVPGGKGILENYKLGDYEAGLDCLRKAVLWLTNVLAKINDMHGNMFSRNTYLASFKQLPLIPKDIVELLDLIYDISSITETELEKKQKNVSFISNKLVSKKL